MKKPLDIFSQSVIIIIVNERETDTMDAFKRETVVGFTCYDINAKCVHNKHRNKDAKMIKRMARRKFKEKLKKILDNLI